MIDRVLDWLEKVNYIGKETYNDIDTWHYSFDQTCLDPTDLPLDMNIEEATGNLYVSAEEPRYLVHLDITLNGSNLRVEGTIQLPIEADSLEYSIDFTGINQTKIKLPATLQEYGNMPEDIPLYKDALQLVTMDMDFISIGIKVHAFQVEASANQVLSFYKTAMAKNGWKLESQSAASGNYTLVFNKKNGNKMSLQIQPLAGSKMTLFVITINL